MWIQFLLENAHFAINVFASLVFFAIFWLHLDAWKTRKVPAVGIRLFGFGILALAYLINAGYIEAAILENPLLGKSTVGYLYLLFKTSGLIAIIVSQLADPLQPRPEYSSKSLNAVYFSPLIISVMTVLVVVQPVLVALIGFLYLRRSTVGLEDHLKPVGLSFYILALADLIGLTTLFETTNNPYLYRLVAPFGIVWIFQHLVILTAMIILGRWVFGYLLKQFQTQLLMIYTWTILIIFLITTTTFTGLLVKNIENQTLAQLETNAKVLEFTLESKKAESLSDATALAQNQLVVQSVLDGNKKTLAGLASQFLLSKNQSFLIVTGESGQVLARGEDSERLGDSLSDDPLVRRGLLGEPSVSVSSTQGVLAPVISVSAVYPVYAAGKIIGTVVTGTKIDNAFVDGIKKSTGLETVVYGGNQISAGTLKQTDGTNRLAGIKEEHSQVKVSVLEDGKPYTGSINILNIPYYSSFLPVKNIDGNPVGMLMAAKPQYSVLTTAGKSIELTFFVTIILMVLSMVPSYLVSRYIAGQIK